MSEIEDVLALYGAIDRAVEGNSTLLGEVAVMLPRYQAEIIGGGEAHTGWFDRLLDALTLVNGGNPTQGLSPPASSLNRPLGDALGGLSDVPPRGRLGVRRLIALATLARIGERLDPMPSPGALSTAMGLGAIGSDLLPALAAAREVPQILELVPASIMSHEEKMLSSQSSPVCDGKWWVAPDPSSVPVAKIRTEFQVSTKTLTYAKLTKFLDPALWPANHPFWCCMANKGKTTRGTLYQEKVSFDCGRPGSVWGTSVLLEFTRTDYKKAGSAPRRSRLHYDLASKPTANDTVQVDVGDIIVIDAPRGFVTIETTKRLGFHPPTATPSLAEGLCYAGYWDAVHDLVLRCASPGTTAPFPTDCS